MTKRVAVLGGGVAGMSAAHELIERGFEVEVHERRGVAGGKARSMDATGPDVAGLPGEHGFRFFPGFYRHLPDTMSRIPFGGHPRGVAGNLVPTTESAMARIGEPLTVLPDRFPLTLRELWQSRHFLDFPLAGISVLEMAYFIKQLFVLLASCRDRRYDEWERMSWWDFIGAAKRSSGYQQFLADGMTRKLVAAQAKEASARTIGYILLQLLQNFVRPREPMDRVLNGPTSKAWIEPWLEYLRWRGVKYSNDSNVRSINLQDGRVSSVTIEKGGTRQTVMADYYIAAVPVECMSELVDETPALTKADPQLGWLDKLESRWMNGIQFYLKNDVRIAHGHTIYADSPFALTSISQHQFWPVTPLVTTSGSHVQGVLSVDISDWTTPGYLYGKPAKELQPHEVKEEVWAQLKAHLNVGGKDVLDDGNLFGSFLDPAIQPPNLPGASVNLEPLLVNTRDSWYSRPRAVTDIDNLFLASDYVKTWTDLASMEGANEAARRAVNGILAASRSSAPRCKLWRLWQPFLFAPLRLLDAIRYQGGNRAGRLNRVQRRRMLP